MAQQTINLGTVANDGTGDTLRDGGDKANDNFTELYAALTTDRAVADGGTGASTAAGARTNLGATTVGANVFTLTNPSAITFMRLNADNTVDALSAAAFRTAIGAGTGSGSGDLLAANNLSDVASAATSRTNLGVAPNYWELLVAVSDETTAISTGTAKVTFRMPRAVTLTEVRASLSTASSSGTPTIDINEAGATILSTKLTIDASELTSVTAATPAVISDASLADDAEMTIDIDVAGTGAKGLKVLLKGTI